MSGEAWKEAWKRRVERSSTWRTEMIATQLSATTRPKINRVLVQRLFTCRDPFLALSVRAGTNLERYRPRADYVDHCERTRAYHYGRIRFFRDAYMAGEIPDPIDLDNEWRAFNYPQNVCIYDGHHRLCGAILAKVERVPVAYSGCLDALRWLEGKRKTPPGWLSI